MKASVWLAIIVGTIGIVGFAAGVFMGLTKTLEEILLILGVSIGMTLILFSAMGCIIWIGCRIIDDYYPKGQGRG